MLEEISNKIKNQKAVPSTLLINARVQTSSKILSQLISAAIRETEKRSGCKILVKSIASFQPGYPKPTYRIAG